MLDIIYQDNQLIAINKPSGLLVHRSAIDSQATKFALQMVRDQINRRVYPVHRLDKPTSGVLLFALDADSASFLSTALRERTVQKTYLAIVRGYTETQGSIDHPFKDDYDSRTGKKAESIQPKEALSHYRTLARAEIPFAVDRYPYARYSLVEVQPVTGRKHQIRRHLKHVTHPIIGDAKHGKSRHNHFFREQFGVEGLLLHCVKMCAPHPVTQQTVCMRAPVNEMFLRAFDALGWTMDSNSCLHL